MGRSSYKNDASDYLGGCLSIIIVIFVLLNIELIEELIMWALLILPIIFAFAWIWYWYRKRLKRQKINRWIEFRDKIIFNSPVSDLHYAQNFIFTYGSCFNPETIEFFLKLLQDNGISKDWNSNNFQEKLEAASFEIRRLEQERLDKEEQQRLNAQKAEEKERLAREARQRLEAQIEQERLDKEEQQRLNAQKAEEKERLAREARQRLEAQRLADQKALLEEMRITFLSLYSATEIEYAEKFIVAYPKASQDHLNAFVLILHEKGLGNDWCVPNVEKKLIQIRNKIEKERRRNQFRHNLDLPTSSLEIDYIRNLILYYGDTPNSEIMEFLSELFNEKGFKVYYLEYRIKTLKQIIAKIDRRKIEEEVYQKFLASQDYQLITNFVNKPYKSVRRVKDEDDDDEDDDDEFDYDKADKWQKHQDIARLQALLARNWTFNQDQLAGILHREEEQQIKRKLFNQIQTQNPANLDEYLSNFIAVCGEKSTLQFPLLMELLKEKGVQRDEDPSVVQVALVRMIEKIELEEYERNLLRAGTGINLEQIDRFNGFEFESFLKQLYENMGYQVEQTQQSRDQGADLVTIKFGERSVVQAKRYSNVVGNKAVQEIVAAKAHYGAENAIVVTTNYFTKAAIELAEANQVKLINRDELERLIEKYW